MRWLLVGYCGLALINISVALDSFIGVTQLPRLCVMTAKHNVILKCWISKNRSMSEVEWYKADEYNAPKTAQILTKEERILINTTYILNMTRSGTLYIRDLRTEDTGVYFCKINGTWGPGSHLQVFRAFDPEKAAYRTKMKDGLMILQGLLLAMFIGGILLRKRTLLEKNDSLYEEPETDHIYEGLTIETCGGGLYEELSVYAQAEGAEAPWE